MRFSVSATLQPLTRDGEPIVVRRPPGGSGHAPTTSDWIAFRQEFHVDDTTPGEKADEEVRKWLVISLVGELEPYAEDMLTELPDVAGPRFSMSIIVNGRRIDLAPLAPPQAGRLMGGTDPAHYARDFLVMALAYKVALQLELVECSP